MLKFQNLTGYGEFHILEHATRVYQSRNLTSSRIEYKLLIVKTLLFYVIPFILLYIGCLFCILYINLL